LFPCDARVKSSCTNEDVSTELRLVDAYVSSSRFWCVRLPILAIESIYTMKRFIGLSPIAARWTLM